MNGMFNLHLILIACSLFAASFLKTMQSLNTHVILCNLRVNYLRSTNSGVYINMYAIVIDENYSYLNLRSFDDQP